MAKKRIAKKVQRKPKRAGQRKNRLMLRPSIPTIRGRGDYMVNGNSLMQGGMTVPQVVTAMKHDGIVVRHREYIADINATVNFTNSSFALNPGLTSSFPWLADVANAFEEYRWRGLILEFKSLSSDAVLSASTSSALGSVIMATQYNSLNPLFANKQQMENYDFANSSKPSCSFIHPVECDPKQNPLERMYIRQGAIPPNADLRLYDLGIFQIATVGMQAASGVAGELWASYEVEFYKPRFNPINDAGQAGLVDHFFVTTVQATNPLGSGGHTARSGSTLGCTINATGTTITFPAVATNGRFMVLINYIGSSGTWIPPSITGTGASTVLLWNNNAQTFINAPQTGSGTITDGCIAFLVDVFVSGATVALGTSGTILAATPNADVWIMQVDNSIN